MTSGVQVSEHCKRVFHDVKMNLQGKDKLPYAIFRLDHDMKQIVVDDEITPRARHDENVCQDFNHLLCKLPDRDGRYIVYDYHYNSSFGPTSKMIMCLWVPECTPIKTKMVYAASKDALKKAFGNECVEFQAGKPEDLSVDDVEQKLKKV